MKESVCYSTVLSEKQSPTKRKKEMSVGRAAAWLLVPGLTAAYEIVESVAYKLSENVNLNQNDYNNILAIIEKGKELGFEELEINIEKTAMAKMGIKMNVPIEGVPVGVEATPHCSNSGNYIIKIKYNVTSNNQTGDLETIQKLKTLFDSGALSEEEFISAKQKVLANL